MKRLKDFLFEEMQDKKLENLVVTYKVLPYKISFNAPLNFSEDEAIQYLQDLWFNNLPGGDDKSEKFFGANREKLIDVYLEYDGFTHSKDEIHADKFIEWDPKFSPDNDNELEYFSIANVTYNLSFEDFDIKMNENDKIGFLIEKIFKAFESNAYNKYPIEIRYKSAKYNEGE